MLQDVAPCLQSELRRGDASGPVLVWTFLDFFLPRVI
jgi:hypothetical protein